MLESDYRESVKSRARTRDTYNTDVVGLNAMPNSHPTGANQQQPCGIKAQPALVYEVPSGIPLPKPMAHAKGHLQGN